MSEKRKYLDTASTVYLRGIEKGDYSLYALLEEMREKPRVISPDDLVWRGGPVHWNKFFSTPAYGSIQSIEAHLEEMAPGGHSHNHGHMNGAVFYIVEGRGYDIHDGIRYDWQAGDVLIVHPESVHQHFNADPERRARMLVMKTKPAYMFLNLLFQKRVSEAPAQPIEGLEDYHPEEGEEDVGA